ncbi:hypothetical protein LTR95_013667 [Oleoguttula sp. CCFEE 5521]
MAADSGLHDARCRAPDHTPCQRNAMEIARIQSQGFALSQYSSYKTRRLRMPSGAWDQLVFTGLLVALWTYKCIMTVLFQDKIIYMPYMPPFARSEKLSDYTGGCKPVQWTEHRVRSIDGTTISLAVGTIPEPLGANTLATTDVVILYFQGNGGSTPARLPLLTSTLKLVNPHSTPGEMRYTIIAVSYRGYWTSQGRASERGIKLDAAATLAYVAEKYPSAQVILWGQSIGAGVACAAAAEYLTTVANVRIVGLILETPFTSVKSMLIALYPQKWLPYRYLHSFLWNHWDSGAALQRIAATDGSKPHVLLLPATRDEVVPPEEIEKLASICTEARLSTRRVDVLGALHTEATTRREGQQAVAEFVRDVYKDSQSK